MDDCMFFYNVF